MIEYNAGGTVGDAYIILCKLYEQAKLGPIKIYHKTKHPDMYGQILSVYSLMPNISVEFIDAKKADFPDKDLEVYHGNFVNDNIPATMFPEFKSLDEYKNNDYGRYMVIAPKSGRAKQNREIMKQKLDIIVYNNEKKYDNIILIGKDYEYKTKNDKIINFIDETSLHKAFGIIMNAEIFHGFQGVLCWFALSQKVPSYAYWRSHDDVIGIRARASFWADNFLGSKYGG